MYVEDKESILMIKKLGKDWGWIKDMTQVQATKSLHPGTRVHVREIVGEVFSQDMIKVEMAKDLSQDMSIID